MAMNEALTLGVPLVLTQSVGFPAAEKAGAAHVVPSEPAKVAAAITSILEDPILEGKMRSAGKNLGESVLAWPKVANRLISIYQKIISSAPLTESDLRI